MLLMIKDNVNEWVADCHVESYKEEGWEVVDLFGEKEDVTHEEDAVVEPVQPQAGVETDEPKEMVFEQKKNGKWQCPYCEKDYSTVDNLKRHIADKHAE